MVSLRKYFLENLEKDSHYKIYKNIILHGYETPFDDNVIPDMEFPITSALDEVIIRTLREYIMPRRSYSTAEEYEFILLCFYLNHNGYYIKEFPDILKAPTDLYEFANNKIRTYLLSKGEHKDGIVKWDTRRVFVSALNFLKQESIISNFPQGVDEAFKRISTRGSKFDEMSNPEKLKEISNMIEHILKKDGKFISIDESKTLDLITNQDITDYRKKLHCYRHSDDKHLVIRKKYESKELFLIHLGISIIHAIYDNVKRT